MDPSFKERIESLLSRATALATNALSGLNGGTIYSGTTTLVGGTKTIPAPWLTANTRIVTGFIVPVSGGGAGTAKLAATNRLPGVSFTIDALTAGDVFNGLDSSNVDWIAVVNP